MSGLCSFEFFLICEEIDIKTILVGTNVSDVCRVSLEKFGYNIVKLPPFGRIQKGVSSHADMLLFCDGRELITHKEYYEENKSLLDSLGLKITLSDENISADYPNDILFNALLTRDGTLFSKSDYTSRLVKKKAAKIIRVKQGYVKCSTCVVSDSAFITSDRGLYNAFIKSDIDALLISSGHIDLPPYEYGFIGGASVNLGDSICFFGRIENHPDFEKISAFLSARGKRIVSLSDEKLTDVGGAIVLE